MNDHEVGFRLNVTFIGIGFLLVLYSIITHLLHPLDGIRFLYNPLIFMISIFISLPITMIFLIIVRTIVGGGQLQYGIKNPKAQKEIILNDSIEDIKNRIVNRLNKLPFHYKIDYRNENKEIWIVFTKDKENFISKFLAHAFRGSIIINESNNRCHLKGELILLDTVLFETGEISILSKILAYILTCSEKLVFTDVSSTFDMAFVLSVLNLLIWSIGHNQSQALIGYSYTVSLASLSILAFSIKFIIQSKTWDNTVKGVLAFVMILIPFITIF